MKKKVTATIVSIIIALAIFVTGVYAGTKYIKWPGTEDYYSTLSNLDAIEQEFISKDEYIQQLIENSTDDEVIKQELRTLINATNEQNGPRHKYDELRSIINTHASAYGIEERLGEHGQGHADRQLEQAEKDMRHVEERSREVLEGIHE